MELIRKFFAFRQTTTTDWSLVILRSKINDLRFIIDSPVKMLNFIFRSVSLSGRFAYWNITSYLKLWITMILAILWKTEQLFFENHLLVTKPLHYLLPNNPSNYKVRINDFRELWTTACWIFNCICKNLEFNWFSAILWMVLHVEYWWKSEKP